jgi:hypothetical protein
MSSQAEIKTLPLSITISEDDIYAAMKEIPGYLDITPGDFKELYVHAYQHAIFYALIPEGLGAIIMLLIALLVNNIPVSRRYSEFWF